VITEASSLCSLADLRQEEAGGPRMPAHTRRIGDCFFGRGFCTPSHEFAAARRPQSVEHIG
jgi:hypothetical protein